MTVTNVSLPGLQAGGAITSPSELKSLTQKPVHREVLDVPATRPLTPLAVENSVGKLAATQSVAPNASPGKRAWRTPTPPFSPCSAAKPGRDFMFFLEQIPPPI